jgi:ATP-dependent Clp protease adaptor protein ClpS
MSETNRPGVDTPDGGRETVLERKPKTKKPRMHKVLLHNDDYTTMEFVVFILERIFHKSETEATHLMLTIHHKGLGVAGVFTRDIAETKVQQVLDLAQEHGMPLMCTSEPDE